MAAGIIETVQRMATMLVLVPVAVAGLGLLAEGQTAVGVGLLVVAALVWLISEYVDTPTDMGTSAAEKAAETVVKDPDDES